jgi:hypothetical protein
MRLIDRFPIDTSSIAQRYQLDIGTISKRYHMARTAVPGSRLGRLRLIGGFPTDISSMA